MAISVTQERMRERGETQIHRIRASAALTAFTNALTVSLFALVPGLHLGWVSIGTSAAGLVFVIASLLSLLRLRRRRLRELWEALFLIGLVAVFVVQASAGIQLTSHEERVGDIRTLAILVIACFLIGIARSWELIGGPSIRIGSELVKLLHPPGTDGHRDGEGDGDRDPQNQAEQPATAGDGEQA